MEEVTSKDSSRGDSIPEACVRLAGKRITKEELAKHKSETDCWMVIHGVVYDLTKFLADHPGGTEVLLTSSGMDASDEFEEIGHSRNARKTAEKYEIGLLEGHEQTATGCLRPAFAVPQVGSSNSFSNFGMIPFALILIIAVGAYMILQVH